LLGVVGAASHGRDVEDLAGDDEAPAGAEAHSAGGDGGCGEAQLAGLQDAGAIPAVGQLQEGVAGGEAGAGVDGERLVPQPASGDGRGRDGRERALGGDDAPDRQTADGVRPGGFVFRGALGVIGQLHRGGDLPGLGGQAVLRQEGAQVVHSARLDGPHLPLAVEENPAQQQIGEQEEDNQQRLRSGPIHSDTTQKTSASASARETGR